MYAMNLNLSIQCLIHVLLLSRSQSYSHLLCSIGDRIIKLRLMAVEGHMGYQTVAVAA